MSRSFLVWPIALLMAIGLTSPTIAQVYTITDLGVLAKSAALSYGLGVSPSGQYATGYSFDQSYNWRIWRWNSTTGSMVAVDTSHAGKGYAINDSGHIAGYANYTNGNFPVYFDGTSLKTLGVSYSQSPMGAAYGINSQNTICGQGTWGWSVGQYDTEALIYSPSFGAYGLGRIATSNNTGTSTGCGINEYGKIVGGSNSIVLGGSVTQPLAHAFIWTPSSSNGHSGSMVDIHTTLNGLPESTALGVNNNDEVVGYCENQGDSVYQTSRRAFYKPAAGPMQPLPSIPGYAYQAAEADGISDSGVVIGCAGYLNDRESGGCQAVRWVSGQLQRLDECIDLRSTWQLGEATAITGTGCIVGTGKINYETHAYLLTPVANPTQYPVPQISSIDPPRTRTFPLTVHVYGSGFVAGSVVTIQTPGSVNPTRLTTRFVSSTQLDTDLSDSSMTAIWVQNPRPGGGPSNNGNFTVVQDNPPAANGDSAATSVNTPVYIDVLANDTDPDGDTLSIIWVGSSSYNYGVTDHGGTVSVQTVAGKQEVQYTPPAGWSGTDTFLYTASDGFGGTGLAFVQVTVTANQPPVALPDSATTIANTPVNIDVLANDSDPERDTLTITGVNAPSKGSAQITTNAGKQVVTYTPNPNYLGSDSFNYTISDGHGNSATAAVTVTVQDFYSPIAVDDVAYTDPYSSIDIDVLANDSDPNPGGQIADIIDVSTPDQGGTASVDYSAGPTPQIYYQPDSGYVGIETFTYTIIDNYGKTATATVRVHVGTGLTYNWYSSSPGMTAPGEQLSYEVSVSDQDAPVVSVVAEDGTPLTQESPGGDIWSGTTTTGSSMGWNYFSVTATDGNGATLGSLVWYHNCRVFLANTKALFDPIMQKAYYQYLWAACGTVSSVAGDFFYLDNGAKTIEAYCPDHGLAVNDHVRVDGQWSYDASTPSSSLLYIELPSRIRKF